jgi:thiol-disulfide isomerase/thioredoxin
VYDLQAKHPNSKHFDFYQGKIEKLKNSLELSKQDFTKAKFVKSNYDTFEELLKRFKGKNLLVDIWATWCHPCIEDFRHKSKIQPLMDSYRIELLYISIDKPQWDDRWRQSISINELEGYHFRADSEFIEDMWLQIGDFTGAIPRYVLIDKEGKIFKSTAARPGDGDVLIHQIESLVESEKK